MRRHLDLVAGDGQAGDLAEGAADYLVTGDQQLLRLGAHRRVRIVRRIEAGANDVVGSRRTWMIGRAAVALRRPGLVRCRESPRAGGRGGAPGSTVQGRGPRRPVGGGRPADARLHYR